MNKDILDEKEKSKNPSLLSVFGFSFSRFSLQRCTVERFFFKTIL